MPADVVLKDDAIELIDASVVLVKKRGGRVTVKIEGDIGNLDKVQTRELVASRATVNRGTVGRLETAAVVVGQGTAQTAKPVGVIEVRTRNGTTAVKIKGNGDIEMGNAGSLLRRLLNIERRLSRLERS